MLAVTELAIAAILVLLGLSYFDYKSKSVPNAVLIAALAIIGGLYLLIFAMPFQGLAFMLGIIGVILFIGLRITPIFSMQEIAPLDQVIYLLGFIMLPFITLFGFLIQQGIRTANAKLRGTQQVPLIPTFTIGFIVSFIILASVIGAGNAYL
ncbi:MAG: hypothetical protein KGH64_00780 [Candidatus Micrarchaeota archaeon]|nr:hypothetical protein [Candidatus Micrarchaeota archaeon]